MSHLLSSRSYVLTAIRDGFKTEVFGPVTLPVNQTVRWIQTGRGRSSESIE